MNILVNTHRHYVFMDASLIQGLKNLGHKVCAIEEAGNNYVEYLANTSDSWDLFIQFVKDSHINIPSIKSIMVWGYDGHNGLKNEFLNGYDVIFVRDHLDNNPGIPINFAIEDRYYCQTDNGYKPLKDRTVDICFLGGDHCGRKEYKERLIEDFKHLKLEIGRQKYVAPDDYWSRWTSTYYNHDPHYYEVLADSKICLSFRGGGPDCGRHWEIMASGAVCMIESMKTMEPRPSVYWFDNYEELKKRIEGVLFDIEDFQEEVNNDWKWNREHHSTKARAQYLLDKCGF
jgi:hypothetical protein